ncbi:hypothetical protein [Roseisalinus antarcticus]|uniref:Glycerophosphoryl diester phosphodiesterase membrane domain-containing protein n=1 Tax=Roseisalinus antarcticus TaxID=254357 RepID=A0A1Y5S6C9_9RHOB|nr:hypothetical protein [Roseisalinus antarcticus]SLN32663.1 hypothetical protein ROA7023_01128 [Roseisalinus antarcticus]
MSVNIMRHAILMVLNNLADALRASLGPIMIGVVAVVAIAAVLNVNPMLLFAPPDFGMMDPGAMDPSGMGQMPQGYPQFALLALISAVWSLVIFSWVSVTWHRFILLEEYPGSLPAIADRPIWAYIRKSLWLAILIILVFIPIILLLSLALGPMLAILGQFGALAFSLVLGLIFGYVWLRWSLILPAVAVGRQMTVSESWQATKPMSGTIWGVAFLLILLNFVLGLITLPFGASLVALLLAQIVNWFTLMVGMSVLTTLYGNVVEKRPLAE